MATNDLGSQVGIQAQINDVLNERTKIFTALEASLSKQTKLAMNLQKAMRGEEIEQMAGNLNDLSAAEKAAAEAADAMTKSQQQAAEQQIKNAAISKKLYEEELKHKKQMDVVKNAFSSSIMSVVGFGKAIASTAGSLFNFGLVLLKLPFSLFDAFIDKINSMPYNTALFEALQEIKKQFGDLASGPGKAVKDNLGEIRKNTRDLTGTGLRLASVFGYGPEGIANALKAVNELATNLGAGFYNLTEAIRHHGLELVVMGKGLGLTNEQMAQQLRFAQSMGQDPVKAQQAFASAAIQTAKAFGMSHKIIARGMNELLQQFPNLAKQGPKALAPIVAYAQKLGIEIKDLTGVMDKFSSFESAAESASQLSQAFGVNIDAMRIMAEENPAKKMDQLRMAFQSAGKDASHMGNAERKLAEQLTGVSGAAFDAAFGLGNQKVKMSEVEKQSQQAMKTQMSMTKVMKELGKAIEKIAPPEGEKFEGFFDAFIKGFGAGIFRANDMRRVMWDIRSVMKQLYLAGREVGIEFVKAFPGIKTMLGALADFFSPTKFANFIRGPGGIVQTFISLFKDLQDDPKAGFSRFIDRMSALFDRVFGERGGGIMSKLKAGFGTFTKVIGSLAGAAITELSDAMYKGIQILIGYIQHPEQLANTAGAAGGFINNLFGPMLKSLSLQAPLIWQALKDLFWTVMKSLKTEIVIATAGFATLFVAKFAAVALLEVAKQKIAKSIIENGIMKTFGSVMKTAGFIAIGVMVAKGIFDGISAGINAGRTGGALKGIEEGAIEFGASVLESLTFGLIDAQQWKNLSNGVTRMLASVNDSFRDVESFDKNLKHIQAMQRDMKKVIDEQDEGASAILKNAKKLTQGPGAETVEQLAKRLAQHRAAADAMKEVEAGKLEQFTKIDTIGKRGSGWSLGGTNSPEYKAFIAKKEKEYLDASKSEIESALASVEDPKRNAEIATVELLTGKIDTVTSLNDKLNVVVAKLKKIDPVQLDALMKKAVDIVAKYWPIIDAGLKNMAAATKSTDTGPDMTRITDIGHAVAKVADDMMTAGTSFKTVADVVNVVSKFKGGKLEVTHNIPGVQMNVQVNLDAKRLLEELVLVDLDKTAGKFQGVALTTDTPGRPGLGKI